MLVQMLTMLRYVTEMQSKLLVRRAYYLCFTKLAKMTAATTTTIKMIVRLITG